MINLLQATAADVPELAAMILALRKVTADTSTATTKAQGIVFRNIPAAVLVELISALERVENPLGAVLSGR